MHQQSFASASRLHKLDQVSPIPTCRRVSFASFLLLLCLHVHVSLTPSPLLLQNAVSIIDTSMSSLYALPLRPRSKKFCTNDTKMISSSWVSQASKPIRCAVLTLIHSSFVQVTISVAFLGMLLLPLDKYCCQKLSSSHFFTFLIYIYIRWLNMYASPDSIFPINLPVIQLSHSDFSVLEIDYDAEVAQGKHEKMYDFIYVMTNTEAEVKVDCTGWGAYAKNWPLAKKAMDIMCLEMNFTGVVLGIVDSNGNSCEIPPSCQDKLVTAPYVNYFEGLNFMRQSKFLLLPQVYDASPRVAVEAMSLNIPLLMNNQIVGGWKYINEQTGEFFNDNMSDFRSSLAKLVSRLDSYSPRSYVELNYGTKKAGSKLRAFVEENFSDRVSLPKKSHLLIPSEPIKMTSPKNDKMNINTHDTVESVHVLDERSLFDTDGIDGKKRCWSGVRDT